MIQLLEVAIGLIFAFTLVSLAASTINEWISALLAKRGKLLFEGLRVLVGDAMGSDVWKHALIRGLAAPEKKENPNTPRRPSHVPSNTFVQALLAVVVDKAKAVPSAAGTFSFAEILGAVNQLPDGDAKSALLALAQDAEGKVDAFKKNIAAWFDAGMERVSAQYKRWTQRALFVIGFLLALFIGVDALYIAKTLWYDDGLRQEVVSQATALVEAEQARLQAAQPAASPAATAEPVLSASSSAPAEPVATPSASVEPTASPAAPGSEVPAATVTPTPAMTDEAVNRLAEQVDAIEQSSLPLVPLLSTARREGWPYLWHLFGFLLTALASCLGAPFWFDLLNKAINLRLGGVVSPGRDRKDPGEQKPGS